MGGFSVLNDKMDTNVSTVPNHSIYQPGFPI
jgi:hypothetical protein